MATFTLLQMTQEVLSSLGSDQVNSFSDNTEATMVAQIIKRKYYDIASRGDLPEHSQMFQLNPSSNQAAPVLMFIPSDVTKVEWMKYFDTSVGDTPTQFGSFSHDLNTDLVSNTKWLTLSSTSNTVGLGNKTFTVQSGLPVVIGQTAMAVSGTVFMLGPVVSYSGTTMVINVTQSSGAGTFNNWVIMNSNGAAVQGYKYVTVLPIDQFIDMVNSFNPTDPDVSSFQFAEGAFSFNLYFKTDQQPRYCTILENFYVIFDSYDSTQDNALQASKTLVYGSRVPDFLLQDNFIPDIDDQQFSLLINEAKALAWVELRQMPNSKAEQEIKRQWAAVQKDKSVSGKPIYFDQFPYFGRK